ncbi:MFS transporter [Streptomyces sp. NBC_00237]|uniref:MFS transporter n=1 Tax=Streptomyces sp. NBC_00237 TaxID=2975687 RepID=UPI00224D2BD7|nr:MFS transporter [Streptomyces sp. NBC_00237]MCX5202015.1 MFS transporter [Streptomyces sp. NBC_00237]
MIDARQRSIALLVAGCFFMENLDGTLVSTAAPDIAASLHTTPATVGLLVTAYLVTLAVLIPLSGWLTVRLGARRVLLGAITVFTLASLGCALATDVGQLVALRVLQGAGGAMMVPVGRLVVLGGAAKPDIPRLVAFIVWPALIAPVIAPLLGGLLTTYANWRWLFLINVPLGLLALLVTRRLIPAGGRGTPPPLDLAGTVLVCAGLGGITWAAHLVSEPVGPWGTTVAVAAASALALLLVVRHLLRTRHPLIDLRTLRVATFRASVTGGSLFWIVVGAVPFLLPLLFQDVFGWSAVKSGAVVLFVFVGNIGIKPSTTWLLHRFGFRTLLVVATVGLAATTAACGFLTADTPVAVIAALAVLSGAARSLGLTCYMTISFGDVPPERMRDANTLSATSQQLMAGLGVAVGVLALRAGGAVSAEAAYPVAFGLLAVVALAATAGALRLGGDAGRAVLGGREKAAVAAD